MRSAVPQQLSPRLPAVSSRRAKRKRRCRPRKDLRIGITGNQPLRVEVRLAACQECARRGLGRSLRNVVVFREKDDEVGQTEFVRGQLYEFNIPRHRPRIDVVSAATTLAPS